MGDSQKQFNEPPSGAICPHCGALNGRPCAVRLGAGVKTIRFVCEACHDHWEERFPDTTMKPIFRTPT